LKKLFILVVILVLLPIRFGWGQDGHRSKMGKLAHEVAMEVDSILEGKPITVYALDTPRPIGYWVGQKRAWCLVDTLPIAHIIRDVPDTHWVYPVEYEPILDSTWGQAPTLYFTTWDGEDSTIPGHLGRGEPPDSITMGDLIWVPDSTWRIDTVGWVRK
jgi:hypothetical protein